MKYKSLFIFVRLIFILALIYVGSDTIQAQEKEQKIPTDSYRSLGGKEHDSNILGVTIGMDVSTALEAVFINAKREPGQERPDAKKNEGKDIRVVYKNLPQGELQILFADGKFVKEMVLIYAKPPLIDDLRLPFTSALGDKTGLITTSTVEPSRPDEVRGELSTNTKVLDGAKPIDGFNAAILANTNRGRGEALEGTRFDDRYTIGFTDNLKQQRVWSREEKVTQGYKILIQFVSEKNTKAGATFVVKIAQKRISVDQDSERGFRTSSNLSNQ